MDFDKLDRINVYMKQSTSVVVPRWSGVKVIKGVTDASDRLLSFEHDRAMVVVNWSDVREAHFYEGED